MGDDCVSVKVSSLCMEESFILLDNSGMPRHVQVYPYLMKLTIDLYGVFVYVCVASACVDSWSSCACGHVGMWNPKADARHLPWWFSALVVESYAWVISHELSRPQSSPNGYSNYPACFRNSPPLLSEVRHCRQRQALPGFSWGSGDQIHPLCHLSSPALLYHTAQPLSIIWKLF